MRTTKKNLIAGLIGAIICVTFHASAQAECKNLIENKSDKAWFFLFETDLPVLVDGKSCYRTGCTILPHSKVPLVYTMTIPDIAELHPVKITSPNNITKTFSFHKHRTEQCIYVHHDDESTTGGVSLNDPENGSFIIWQNSW